MSDYVQAIICYPHGWEDLRDRGGPGAMWPVADDMMEVEERLVRSPRLWNVCCPGCGRMVYEFRSGREAILGGVADRPVFLDGNLKPSLGEPVEFVPCGCGTWDLSHGVWRFLREFSNAPRD